MEVNRAECKRLKNYIHMCEANIAKYQAFIDKHNEYDPSTPLIGSQVEESKAKKISAEQSLERLVREYAEWKQNNAEEEKKFLLRMSNERENLRTSIGQMTRRIRLLSQKTDDHKEEVNQLLESRRPLIAKLGNWMQYVKSAYEPRARDIRDIGDTYNALIVTSKLDLQQCSDALYKTEQQEDPNMRMFRGIKLYTRQKEECEALLRNLQSHPKRKKVVEDPTIKRAKLSKQTEDTTSTPYWWLVD